MHECILRALEGETTKNNSSNVSNKQFKGLEGITTTWIGAQSNRTTVAEPGILESPGKILIANFSAKTTI
jgi:hypothetical protein